jgi:hypothetical protein
MKRAFLCHLFFDGGQFARLQKLPGGFVFAHDFFSGVAAFAMQKFFCTEHRFWTHQRLREVKNARISANRFAPTSPCVSVRAARRTTPRRFSVPVCARRATARGKRAKDHERDVPLRF